METILAGDTPAKKIRLFFQTLRSEKRTPPSFTKNNNDYPSHKKTQECNLLFSAPKKKQKDASPLGCLGPLQKPRHRPQTPGTQAAPPRSKKMGAASRSSILFFFLVFFATRSKRKKSKMFCEKHYAIAEI